MVYGTYMETIWKIYGKLIGGDWNHGIL